jgi:hypothetical protein
VNPLDLLLVLIEKYVAITPEERLAVALWILHTYVYDQYRETPRLALLSPVNGCGKTTLLSLLDLLVRYPSSTANTSAAVLYYALERNPLTTWLLDEGDNLELQRNAVARSVLNMGHTRGAAVYRMVNGEPHKMRAFRPSLLLRSGHYRSRCRGALSASTCNDLATKNWSALTILRRNGRPPRSRFKDGR